ncbi:UNVERIFIED_CONTAM: yfcH [Trichonephila clavipes]
MDILITGGTGFIGSLLVPVLAGADDRDQGDRLTLLTRHPERAAARHAGLVARGRVRLIRSLDELGRDEAFDAVINLAGEGIADRPWTAQRRRELHASRIVLTESLGDWMRRARHKPSVLISGSAVGWYGDQGNRLLEEEAAADTGAYTHRLCDDWEKAALAAAPEGTRVCILRTGVVIGPGGGLLRRLLPLFGLGLGGPVGSGEQYVSWRCGAGHPAPAHRPRAARRVQPHRTPSGHQRGVRPDPGRPAAPPRPAAGTDLGAAPDHGRHVGAAAGQPARPAQPPAAAALQLPASDAGGCAALDAVAARLKKPALMRSAWRASDFRQFQPQVVDDALALAVVDDQGLIALRQQFLDEQLVVEKHEDDVGQAGAEQPERQDDQPPLDVAAEQRRQEAEEQHCPRQADRRRLLRARLRVLHDDRGECHVPLPDDLPASIRANAPAAGALTCDAQNTASRAMPSHSCSARRLMPRLSCWGVQRSMKVSADASALKRVGAGSTLKPARSNTRAARRRCQA